MSIKVSLEEMLRLIKNGKRMPRKMENADDGVEVVVSSTRTLLLGSYIEKDEEDTEGGFGLCDGDKVWTFRCGENGEFRVNCTNFEEKRVYFQGNYRGINQVISAVQKAV